MAQESIERKGEEIASTSSSQVINENEKMCLMAKEDEVCDDDLDDYDDIQHEYDCLFNDFEKLMEKM